MAEFASVVTLGSSSCAVHGREATTSTRSSRSSEHDEETNHAERLRRSSGCGRLPTQRSRWSSKHARNTPDYHELRRPSRGLLGFLAAKP
jgi:hypothetical protein